MVGSLSAWLFSQGSGASDGIEASLEVEFTASLPSEDIRNALRTSRLLRTAVLGVLPERRLFA